MEPCVARTSSASASWPTANNGFAYKATRQGSAYPAWTGRVVRAIGDRVEPSTYNGYYYEVVDVDGTNPSSGDTEPSWPTEDGALVIEAADGLPGGGTTTTPTTPREPTPVPPGGNDDNPYDCLVEDCWMSPTTQVRDYITDMLADLHTPEDGHHRGPLRAMSRAFVPCVRLVTQSGSVSVSTTTPVNHYEATSDLEDGHWSWAPDMLGKNMLVGNGPEPVLRIVDIGYQWVRKMDFDGKSIGASDQRVGPRLYTHNSRKNY
jgi:hypothetical protein